MQLNTRAQKPNLWHHYCILFHLVFISARLVQFTQLCPTLWTAAHQASLSVIDSRRLLRLLSIESVMPSNHLILCCPLLLLPSIFPGIRVFSSESVLHIRWPRNWYVSFSISPSNEYSGLISIALTGLISLLSKGLSRAFSNTTVQKHQFFGVQASLYSNSYIHNDYWKNHSFD